MKYIVLDHTHLYLFPRCVSHVEFFNRIVSPPGCCAPPQICTSAGFVRLTGPVPECYGESESLGVICQPKDNILAKIMFDIKT